MKEAREWVLMTKITRSLHWRYTSFFTSFYIGLDDSSEIHFPPVFGYFDPSFTHPNLLDLLLTTPADGSSQTVLTNKVRANWAEESYIVGSNLKQSLYRDKTKFKATLVYFMCLRICESPSLYLLLLRN